MPVSPNAPPRRTTSPTTHNLLGTTPFRPLRSAPESPAVHMAARQTHVLLRRTQDKRAARRPVSLTLPNAGSSSTTVRTSSVTPNAYIAGRDATGPMQTTILLPLLPSPRPPPSLLTPAALNSHTTPNAASHLPPVSRDGRYAYRTRISGKPSSPCRHGPKNAYQTRPCTPPNTQTRERPKPDPARNASHSPSPTHYPRSLHNHADGSLHNCLCVYFYCIIRRTLCDVRMQ